MPQLAALAELTTLDLSRTRIGDGGLATLASLASLRRLFVRHTDVSKEAVAKLKGARPGLKVYV
ncbi:MAG: hypothetical protein QGG36_18130 [Pirellulaceae bacterium]|nr:hypothetical protein [Pirellulaceae bacterium]MDP7017729.1 hypothetical protein [Pirellulaceae bacterium]